MSSWQSIETAPKDGTFVILSAGGLWVRGARWVNSLGGWFTSDGIRIDNPVYWIPIPTQPSKPEKCPDCGWELGSKGCRMFRRITDLEAGLASTVNGAWLPGWLQARVRDLLDAPHVPQDPNGGPRVQIVPPIAKPRPFLRPKKGWSWFRSEYIRDAQRGSVPDSEVAVLRHRVHQLWRMLDQVLALVKSWGWYASLPEYIRNWDKTRIIPADGAELESVGTFRLTETSYWKTKADIAAAGSRAAITQRDEARAARVNAEQQVAVLQRERDEAQRDKITLLQRIDALSREAEYAHVQTANAEGQRDDYARSIRGLQEELLKYKAEVGQHCAAEKGAMRQQIDALTKERDSYYGLAQSHSVRINDLDALRRSCQTGQPFSFAGTTFVPLGGDLDKQEQRVRDAQAEAREIKRAALMTVECFNKAEERYQRTLSDLGGAAYAGEEAKKHIALLQSRLARASNYWVSRLRSCDGEWAEKLRSAQCETAAIKELVRRCDAAHGWRPINTITKPGDAPYPYDALFVTEKGAVAHGYLVRYGGDVGGVSYWFRTRDGLLEDRATHWMPLPGRPA